MVSILPNSTLNTGLVTFTVKIDGQAVSSDYRILQVDVMREVNRIPSAKLIIADGDPALQDFEVSSSAGFIPGKAIEIQAGYALSEETIFKGIIIKHGIKVSDSQSSVLIIECRDEAYKMSIGRNNKSFDESSDSDIISGIVANYGLTNDVDPTTAIHEKIIQYNVSDWDFINLRAEMNSLFVMVDDGHVEVKKLDPAQSAVMPLSYGASILGFEAEIDSRNQFKGIKAESWDSAGQEMIEMEGQSQAIPDPGNLTSDELANVAGLDFLMLRHSGQITDAELKAWSDAMLNRSRLARNVGRIKIQGIPDLKPGQVVELQGLGNRFNGNAIITAVRHEIADGDWNTRLVYGLKFETFAQNFKETLQQMPASGLIPSVHGLQAGVVTVLENDPKSEFRIKVKLPAINPNDEGLWARIALPDAGNNRGFMFMPEIGDEVIVGFMNEDPRNPVILGMLHSSVKPAPFAATDSNNQKAMVTRSGMKISFDDDKKSVEISTPAGFVFHLDEDQKEILLEDTNRNKIKMNSDGITLESGKDVIIKATNGNVTFDGINITQKASAQLKIEGSAGVEAKSSGTMVIKGSIVQIN
jgi:Rhs element Vgr protein